MDWFSHFDLWGSLRGWSCEVISYCWGKDLEVLVAKAKTNIGSDHNNLLLTKFVFINCQFIVALVQLLLLYICLLCDEILLRWKFGNPGFNVKAPEVPQIWTKWYLFHILDLNFKSYYQIASLFHMYIDMGERIAEKQDRRPSPIIEVPLK